MAQLRHTATPLSKRLALHTWSVDTTPLAGALRAAREGGWNAMELRRIDFVRCYEAGMAHDEVIDLIRKSGMKVAVLGTESGLLFAKGEERTRLFGVLEESCANAKALGCDLIMLAPGHNTGSLDEAVASFREAGDVVQAHGVRIALEFSSQHGVINRLEVAREILSRAAHPSCGLLLDAYHLERSGAGGRGFEGIPAAEIFTFQFSDVPAGPPPAGKSPTDRLIPGDGRIRWKEVFALLVEKGYDGYLSYEAPNPKLWARPPVELARDAAAATRRLLAEVE